MTRTDRLYALIGELRGRAPHPCSVHDLAERFEVSADTIERDIEVLRQAGVPIHEGPDGGYTLDMSKALPPINLSAAEAIAVAISLSGDGASPVVRSARSALCKMVAAMSAADDAETRELAEQVRLLIPDRDADEIPVPAVVEEAVATRQVVRLTYAGRDGTETTRDVEPVAFVAGAQHWHFIGWCRLREAPRIFRLDRIRQASLLDEIAPQRDFSRATPRVTDLVAHALRRD